MNDLGYYLSHIKICSPLLLIGGYKVDFKNIIRESTKINPNNKNYFSEFFFREKADINKFLEENYGRTFPTILVLDIGVNLVNQVDSLLKFVEEYTGPLIITSQSDINNLVFLSRFKVAMRKSKEDVNFLLPSHKNTLANGIDDGTKLSDPIIWFTYLSAMNKFSSFCSSYSRANEEVTKCIDIIFS